MAGHFFWLGASADETPRDLRLAAEFISTDGGSLDTDEADRIAQTLMRLAREMEGA
jgi:hypothetical protein